MQHKQLASTIVALLTGAALTALAHRPLIRALETDPNYKMFTRAAAERRLRRLRGGYDIVLLDIDAMKQLNTDLGYAEVNRLIRESFQLRDDDVFFIWRHFSGDEVGIVVKRGQGDGLKERLEARLASFGLSAQIAVVPSLPPVAAIEVAEQQVLELKQRRLLAA